MATFIKTGALVRRTHRPCAIFLSRPLYLYEQCRRLLQSTDKMLLDAPVVSDDLFIPVKIVTFTSTTADAADQLDEDHTDARSDGNRTDVTSVDGHDPFEENAHLEDQLPEAEQCNAEQPPA